MWRWKDKKIEGVDFKKIAKNWITYLVLTLALFAMAFFGVCSPQGGRNPASLTGAAAKVDGSEISAKEFKRSYQNYYSQYQRQYRDNFDPAMMQLSKQVLSGLVDMHIQYQEALKSGLYASDEEVDKMLLDVEAFKNDDGRFSVKKLDTYMKYNGYTEKSFSDEIKRNLTLGKYRNVLMDSFYLSEGWVKTNYQLTESKIDVEYIKLDSNSVKIDVSNEEIKAFASDEKNKSKIKDYFDKNKSEFNKEKKVKARHILVAYKGSRNASGKGTDRTKEAAKKRAEMIFGKAKAAGSNFSKLAEQYTDDPSGKKKGGDLGFFGKSAMVKEFSDVAFKLKKGEVSSVVETPFGFHVIKVENINKAISQSLEQATNKIAKRLIKQEKQPKELENLANKLLKNLKEKQPIDSILKQYNLKWMATGDFALNSRYVPGFGASGDILEAFLSLRKNNRLLDNVLTHGNSKYVVRLKSRKDADMSKLTPKKIEELKKQSRIMESYGFLGALNTAIKESYTKGGKVWENPEYRDLDQLRARQNNVNE